MEGWEMLRAVLFQTGLERPFKALQWHLSEASALWICDTIVGTVLNFRTHIHLFELPFVQWLHGKQNKPDGNVLVVHSQSIYIYLHAGVFVSHALQMQSSNQPTVICVCTGVHKSHVSVSVMYDELYWGFITDNCVETWFSSRLSEVILKQHYG